jgi:hypothetical protein
LEGIELLCQKIDAKLSNLHVEKDSELDLMPLIDLTVGSTINGLLFGHGFDEVGVWRPILFSKNGPYFSVK